MNITFEEFQSIVENFSNNYLFGKKCEFVKEEGVIYQAKFKGQHFRISFSQNDWFVDLEVSGYRYNYFLGEGATLVEAYLNFLGIND